MSTLFVTDREISFVNLISRELIQHVVGETIYYYAISVEKTRVHRIYREAIKKTWAPPVQINALVRYDSPTTRTTQEGVDTEYNLEVYFHNQELGERNVVPREGDFVEYGGVFYEIATVTQPQLIFGQIQNKILTKCTCVISRESNFANGNDVVHGIDNSHVVPQVIGVNR